MGAVIYPVASSWCWGGGWLQKRGFHDFAGSAVVHELGGFGGLIGTMILGPRLGYFDDEAERKKIRRKRKFIHELN